MSQIRRADLPIYAFLIVVLLGVGVAFALFFQNIPTDGNSLAWDWKVHLWPSLRAGSPYDAVGHLLNPPWIVVPLLPLGLLPVQVSWGILAYLTLLVMIVSVPRVRPRWLYWLSVIALVMSYPSIRNLVDGNLEALIILGALLILLGYKQERPLLLALGVLLAPTKPQTALLLLLVAGLYTLLTKPPRFWLLTAAYVLPVVLITMLWRGPQWLDLLFRIPDQGSLMDISLVAALERAAIFPEIVNRLLWGLVLLLTVLLVWFSGREISREKAGLLIAASLLIAPYAGSSLSLVAIGLIPLFQKRRILGGVLIALNWLLLFFNRPEYINVLAYYSTLVLLLSWIALGWAVWQDEIRARRQVPKL